MRRLIGRLLGSAALLAGCEEQAIHAGTTATGDAGIYVFAQRTEPAPATVGPVTLFVDVHTVDGTPAAIDTLEAVWLMAAHGHGSSGKALLTATGAGSFRVEGASLAMAGAWQLDLKATGPEGTDEARFAIDVH